MKNLLLAFGLLTSLTAFAGVDLVGTKMGTIKERKSSSEIIYTRDGKDLYFYLSEQGDNTLLKKITIKRTASEVTIAGDELQYRFNILGTALDASADAYEWCWVPYSGSNDAFKDFAPAAGGVLFFEVAVPLCAVVPGIPALVGIILSPIDGIITAVTALTNADVVAVRKFSKLIRGKNVSARKNVFDSLINQINEIK